MASKKLMDMMNEAISLELQVSIQYMWQHVQVKGINSETVAGVVKGISMTEMKHAERIAERLDYLGGTPTTKPAPINVGTTVKEMLETDKMNEEAGIKLYKEIIKVANEEGDVVTRTLFESIVAEEEGHHNTFSTLLEKD